MNTLVLLHRIICTIDFLVVSSILSLVYFPCKKIYCHFVVFDLQGLKEELKSLAMSVFRPDLFNNCVAIVIGGGTGIGRTITYELLVRKL